VFTKILKHQMSKRFRPYHRVILSDHVKHNNPSNDFLQ